MKKILLIGSAVLALAACNKNQTEINSGSTLGTTYSKIAVGLATTETKAETSGEYTASDAENAVTSLTVFNYNGTDKLTFSATSAPALVKVGDNLWSTEEPFKTKAATNAKMALLLNSDLTPTISDDNTAVDFAADWSKLLNYSTNDSKVTSMAMSSFVNPESGNGNGYRTVNILDKKDKNTVKAADAEAPGSNAFSFDVKRILAKVSVQKGTNLSTSVYKLGSSSESLGTVAENMTFAVSNVSKTTYAFAKKDGATSKTLTKFIDPSIVETAPAATGSESYLRLGDASIKDLVKPDASAFHPLKAVAVNASTVSTMNTLNSIYIPENIETEVAQTEAANSKLFWGAVTYAKVYVTFTPSKVWAKLSDGTLKEVNVVASNAEDGTSVVLAGGTFYRGKDNKLYATTDAAEANGNAEYYMYKGGKMGYRALVRAQYSTATGSEGVVVNASVYRNNFYILTITKFEGLGFNYDPQDPNDPNLPKPGNNDNPKEPTVPGGGDQPVNDTSTYMKVTAKVLPMTYVNREVVLTY